MLKSYKKLGFNSYKDYLLGAHWVKFRKEIISSRKICQHCCSKKNLNIHHKNYNNLGKETNEDVIILCNNCHSRFHKKEKWKKKMKNGEDLNFTRVGVKAFKRPLYNLNSNILRHCNRCGENHNVYYKILKNNRMVLRIICPNSKPRTQCIPFEKDLKIPILL